ISSKYRGGPLLPVMAKAPVNVKIINRSGSEAQQIVKRCKLAWITEGDNRFITYVDYETMKAYRAYEDNYNNTGPQLPLIEITDFTFHEFVKSMMEAQAY